MRLVRFAAPFMLLALVGCVTEQGPTARGDVQPVAGPIPPGRAAITISRVEAYFGKATAADIDVNGARFASIDSGATFTGFLQPGPVALSVSCWCGPGRYVVHFRAETGRRYAFEISPRSEQFSAMLAAGVFGLAVDTVANDEASGTFKLTEVSANR